MNSFLDSSPVSFPNSFRHISFSILEIFVFSNTAFMTFPPLFDALYR